MKRFQLQTRSSDRFANITSYSGRFTAASTRPPLTASLLSSHRSLQVALQDFSPPGLLSSSLSAKPSNFTRTKVWEKPGIVLKPLEVQLADFEGNEEDSDQQFLQAFVLRADGDFEGAAAKYKSLLAGYPDHAQARVNIGVCYLKLGKYALAREIYEAGLRIGEDYRLLYNLAILYLYYSEDDKARNCLERAALLVPETDKKPIETLLMDLKPTLPTEGSFTDLRSPQLTTKSAHTVLRRTSKAEERTAEQLIETLGVPEPKRILWSRSFHTVKEDDIRPYTSWNKRIVGGLDVKKSRFIGPPRIPNLIKLKRKATIRPETFPTPPTDSPALKPAPLQRIRLQGPLVQEDLEDEQALRQAEVDQISVYSLKIKSIEVSNVLRKDLNRLVSNHTLLPDSDIDSILNSKLSDEALATARGELTKPGEDRNCRLLLSLLSKLKFFTKFQTDVRVKFLRIGQVMGFSQGQEIFRQGDQGDLMFVILHGSVTVKRTSPAFGADPVIVNTLYDGDSFGELTMFGTQIKGSPMGRTATCIAAERTDLLAIQRESYRSIMMFEIETQLEDKINFLIALPFLSKAQQFSLIPVASNMEPRIYSFNETILRKGEVPSGLYIILSGHCNVYSEGYCIRPRRLQVYATVRVRKERDEDFSFGISPMRFKKAKKKESDEVPLRSLSLETINSTPGLTEEVQDFLQIQDIPSVLKTSFITKERLLKTRLKEKDFFGGRALLEGRETLSKAPSKFSIVAESSKVTIFLITKSLLPLMGEKLMEHIKAYLQNCTDPDCPSDISDQDIIREFQAWTAYKAGVIDEARKAQYLEKTENRGKSAQQLL